MMVAVIPFFFLFFLNNTLKTLVILKVESYSTRKNRGDKRSMPQVILNCPISCEKMRLIISVRAHCWGLVKLTWPIDCRMMILNSTLLPQKGADQTVQVRSTKNTIFI